MILYSKSDYIPHLKAMWKNIFGDNDKYLDAFFNKVYIDENTLVHVENHRVVSSLYMIPYKMPADGGEKKVVYLYALATDPAYRGRGIMSRLIKKSLEISAQRGYSLSALIPAEESLFEYYRQFGYRECFTKTTITKTIEQIEMEAEGHEALVLNKANERQIWDAYTKSEFYSSECIILSEEQNKFYIETLLSEGGEALIFDTGQKKNGYALLKQEDRKILIYESNVDKCTLPSFFAALLKKHNFTSATFHQPICFGENEIKSNTKQFAMAKSLDGTTLTKPFINRVLM